MFVPISPPESEDLSARVVLTWLLARVASDVSPGTKLRIGYLLQMRCYTLKLSINVNELQLNW